MGTIFSVDYNVIDISDIILTLMKLFLINLLSVLISVEEVIILLMIHIPEYVFQTK